MSLPFLRADSGWEERNPEEHADSTNGREAVFIMRQRLQGVATVDYIPFACISAVCRPAFRRSLAIIRIDERKLAMIRKERSYDES